MTHQELKFMTAGYRGDPEIKSLILRVLNETDDEIGRLFCKGDDWEVEIFSPNKQEVCRVSWANFLEIFYRFSIFVAEESSMMLRECEQTLYKPDE